MKCQSWARSGNLVHLRGVAEFFLNTGGGSRLNELSKARPGVSKPPRRKLDSKFVESFPNDFDHFIVHKKVSIRCPNYRRRPSNLTTIRNVSLDKLTRYDLLGPSCNGFCCHICR